MNIKGSDAKSSLTPFPTSLSSSEFAEGTNHVGGFLYSADGFILLRNPYILLRNHFILLRNFVIEYPDCTQIPIDDLKETSYL